MTTETLVTILVGAFVGGIGLLVIGIAVCRAEARKQNDQNAPKGFAIDPSLYRSGRHLPVSRSNEAEFVNRTH